MTEKDKLRAWAIGISIVMGVISSLFTYYLMFWSGLYSILAAVVIILIPGLFVYVTKRRRFPVFSRIYLLVSVVVFLLLIAQPLYYNYWQLPGYENYPNRKEITIAPLEIDAPFSLQTKNLGPLSENVSESLSTFSPDGKKLAYFESLPANNPYANRQTYDKYQVYILEDGHRIPIGSPYDFIRKLAFSENSQQLAFIAVNENERTNAKDDLHTLVIDGKEGVWQSDEIRLEIPAGFVPKKEYDSLNPPPLPCQPHIAIGSKYYPTIWGPGSMEFMVINGHKSRLHKIHRDRINTSNDCTKVAFARQGGVGTEGKDSRNAIIVGDASGRFTEGRVMTNIMADPVFTPDGSFVAYGAFDTNRNVWWIVEDLQQK